MTKGNCGVVWVRFGFALLLLLLLPAVGDSTQAASVTLIPSGSIWKYNDTGANLGTAWKEPGYNDAGWAAGRAQLGYGDGDEVTVVNYGPNSSSKYVTTYFRHVFNLADASRVTALTLEVLRDDGAAVYLNGTLVATFNLPATFISTTFATSASEYGWDPATAIPASLLVTGDNVLAVEVHQGNASSSDLSFDLVLRSEQLLPGSSPQAPQGVAPADGAEGVNLPPTLQVTVEDPDNDPLEVVFYGRKNQTVAPFSVVVLPDTQKYVATSAYAPIFTQQTQWVVDQSATFNILAVAHEGDVADAYSDSAQYDRARTSLSVLDQAGTPYGLLPGNHDQPTTLFNQYFGPSRYVGKPWYGGNFPAGQNDNNYILFSGGGMDFILVQLGFWPSSAAIAWADGVLKAHPNRKAIITTHGYLGLDAKRDVHVMGSTEYIWTGLVVPNPNVWFVLCGHVHGEARRTDYANGHPVYQMLADFQAEVNGGNGWLRILEFLPEQDAVQVRTYSPYLNQYQTDGDSEFLLDFPMIGFKPLGTYAGQPSGSTVSHPWAEAEVGAEYQWFVRVTDPTGRTAQSPVWAFRTALSDVTGPVISQVSVSSVTDRTAFVTWITDEPADSRVYYCANEVGCLDTEDPIRVTQHSLWLEGLTAATEYRFTLTSKDAAGNQTVSPEHFFTTLPENRRPLAEGRSPETPEDVALAITLVGSDPENAPITFHVTSAPTYGILSGTPPNLTYTPAPDWNGVEGFT